MLKCIEDDDFRATIFMNAKYECVVACFPLHSGRFLDKNAQILRGSCHPLALILTNSRQFHMFKILLQTETVISCLLHPSLIPFPIEIQVASGRSPERGTSDGWLLFHVGEEIFSKYKRQRQIGGGHRRTRKLAGAAQEDAGADR
ncbi:hypothetical protein L596_008537 [Steinernema carpocapsae]|uniref:Uncharacterized protein n=1 Tax=Steinernema carpocapsae TaxID=34508 RepID=A0A4V6A6B9_STECR|nr:hypothetical protein L596_008537 [Steinernema carpocapsae]